LLLHSRFIFHRKNVAAIIWCDIIILHRKLIQITKSWQLEDLSPSVLFSSVNQMVFQKVTLRRATRTHLRSIPPTTWFYTYRLYPISRAGVVNGLLFSNDNIVDHGRESMTSLVWLERCTENNNNNNNKAIMIKEKQNPAPSIFKPTNING